MHGEQRLWACLWRLGGFRPWRGPRNDVPTWQRGHRNGASDAAEPGDALQSLRDAECAVRSKPPPPELQLRARQEPILMPKHEKPSSSQHPLNFGSRAHICPTGVVHCHSSANSYAALHFVREIGPTLSQFLWLTCDFNHRRVQALIVPIVTGKTPLQPCNFAIKASLMSFIELYSPGSQTKCPKMGTIRTSTGA
jgi:hypothetical protein